MRIGTLNTGTLTGKSREIADMMTKRGIDILCLQETKWTGGKAGGKARDIGDGCKLYYAGGERPRNGVAICLSNKWMESVVTVKRTSDRIISLKLLTPGKTYNIISVYAPQQGCDPEEKDLFWNLLDEVVREIPSTEELIVAGDMNGHVGRDREAFERWHGGKTVGERNVEGERVLGMAQAYDLALVNTFYTQSDEKLITYKSGGNATVIDYITVRRTQLGRVRNCKVIPGESLAAQHRLLVCDLAVPRIKKKDRKKVRKIRWWKLREEEGQRYLNRIEELVEQTAREDELTWENTYPKVIKMAREELGESRGGKYLEKESWFWNPDVEKRVAEKKKAFKRWQATKSGEDHETYKMLKKEANQAVAIAKENRYEKLYRDLESNGPKKIYKLAKTRMRRAQDIDRLVFVKDQQEKVLTEDGDIKNRWQQYFDGLLNTKNNKEELENAEKTEGPIREVTLEEVKRQLDKMANNKATGPDELPIEVIKLMKETGLEWITSMLAEVQKRGIPEVWKHSTITPLYKRKGDPLNCNNYRGIKLLSHSLKLWERVIESRL
jgi:exonuclease III